MLEYARKTSQNTLTKMAEKTIPEIAALIKLGESSEQFLDNTCASLDARNHLLGKAVRYTQSDMAECLRQEFPGVPREIWEAVGIWSAAGIVAAFEIVLQVNDVRE